jgi:hypothetical protein
VVDVTSERILVEWWNVETVLARNEHQSLGAAFKVESGKPRLIRVI